MAQGIAIDLSLRSFLRVPPVNQKEKNSENYKEKKRKRKLY
jgi:hypothetical protein